MECFFANLHMRLSAELKSELVTLLSTIAKNVLSLSHSVSLTYGFFLIFFKNTSRSVAKTWVDKNKEINIILINFFTIKNLLTESFSPITLC